MLYVVVRRAQYDDRSRCITNHEQHNVNIIYIHAVFLGHIYAVRRCRFDRDVRASHDDNATA